MASVPSSLPQPGSGIPLNRLLRRLVWICLLPLALVAAYLAWNRVETMREANRVAATHRAQNAALIIDLLLRGSTQALQMIARDARIDTADGTERLYRAAQAFQVNYGPHVVLVDRSLAMRFNTRLPLGSAMPALPKPAGRAAVPLALETRRPAVGDSFAGPIAGVPLVALAVPEIRSGETVFLLLATFDGRFMRERLARAALPDGWMISLQDGRGEDIAWLRPPDLEAAGEVPGERFTAGLERADWRVVVEIPDRLYHGPLIQSGSYLLMAILSAILLGALGGTLTGRRVSRAMNALLGRNGAGRPAFDIFEVGEVHRRLKAEAQGREAAEAERSASEDRFRAVVEQSIAGVYMIRGERVAYANPSMREMFGYGPGEAFDTDPLAHVAPEDRERVLAEMRQRIATDVPGEYRFNALRRDGVRIVVEISARRAMLADGWVILAVARDATEAVRAEEEIRRTVERLERAVRSTVAVVSTISELRDPYTHGHESRVGDLAAAIARELGWDEARLEGLRVAGNLHDVGKMGIPAEILAKPTALSKVEMAMVRTHPASGYEILRGVDFPWPVAEAAYQHHERLDGSGYPQGLKDDEIIPEARVLAVADVVEAIASHRPYRPSRGIEVALAEIEAGRGKTYDAAAVDACLRLFRDKGYRLAG